VYVYCVDPPARVVALLASDTAASAEPARAASIPTPTYIVVFMRNLLFVHDNQALGVVPEFSGKFDPTR
jgi:hypothetical protein